MNDTGVITERAERFRSITARYDGTAGCGHLMKKGDEIGYDPVDKRTRCETCWTAIKQRLARSRGLAAQEKLKL